MTDPLLGRVVAGAYRLDELLGQGGMGAVYRAMQISLERVVALKVMLGRETASDVVLKRFRREALAAARLRHPNIVTVYDSGVEADVGAFIVMEYLEGATLAEEIRARRRFDPEEAIELALQACWGVHAAHEDGLIHRDLKPANIFLEKRMGGSGGPATEVKVLDFGLVKVLEDTQGFSITRTGAVLGTPAYMAPEQCEGHEIDRRADVYSLGCVVYEMLAGRPPFRGSSAAAIMLKHMTAEPPPPSQYASAVPRGVDEAVLRALGKLPSERYATVAELGAALQAGVGELASRDPEATPSTTVENIEVLSEMGDVCGAVVVRAREPKAVELTNLPATTVTFVGREAEVAQIRALLPKARLLTLAGTGGIGKTSLAVEVVREKVSEYPDGVWFVDLTPLERGSDIVSAVAAALGVREQGGQTLRATLLQSLKFRRALLLLDNCEHVVESCAETSEALLSSCPGLRILATTRETLRIDAESVYNVPPLGLPEGASREDVSASDAARLFVSRAAMKRPEFALTRENAKTVEAICRHLEGIPLALELAAARMTALTVEQILDRLGDRFRLLSSSGRGVAAKQRTLRATVEWSYELLTDEERWVLRHLAVFEGGCTLDAAEGVAGKDEGLYPSQALDLVEHLVDKSLLTVDTSRDEARYRMLETIRQFALEKLSEAGEIDMCRRRHLDLYLAWAGEAEIGFRGAKAARWFDRIDPEIDNFRVALRLAREHGSHEEVARLASRLGAYWMRRNHWSEGLEWLGYATEGELPDDLLASSLWWMAYCASYRSEYDRASRLFERSLSIARRIGDMHLVARILHSQAAVAANRGDMDKATELASESLKLYEGMNDELGIALVQRVFAAMALGKGDYDAGRVWFERALAIYRRLGDEIGIANVSFHLGGVALQVCDVEGAAEYLEEAESLIRRLGDKFYLAYVIVFLGGLYRQRGDLEKAAAYVKEGIRGMVALGAVSQLVSGFEQLSLIAMAEGKAERALRIDGAGEMLRTEVNFVLTPENLAELRELLSPAWDALGEEVGERVRREGREMTVADAIAYMLE
jgi:serine/threonine-protein kinase PknK